MPVQTSADLSHIVSRLRAIPAVVDQTISLMRAGTTEKMTPPRLVLRDLPGQVMAQVVDDPLKSPMLAAFVKRPSGVPESAWPGLVEQASSAYRQSVAVAF